MNRIWYTGLWIFEVLAVLLIVLILMLPIMDYSRRQYFAWREHPSAQTLQALQDRRDGELRMRLAFAAPVTIVAILVAFPLYRHRRKSAK